MHLFNSFVYAATVPNLFRAVVLVPTWLNRTRQRDKLETQSTSDTSLTLSGIITLHLCIDQSHFCVTYALEDKLAAPVLLGTAIIDQFIESNHSAGRKIFPHHSSTVLILMTHEAQSAVEKSRSDTCQEQGKDLILSVAPIQSDPTSIPAARQVVLKAMCEMPVLVCSQAAGLIEIILHKNLGQRSCLHDDDGSEQLIRRELLLYHYFRLGSG